VKKLEADQMGDGKEGRFQTTMVVQLIIPIIRLHPEIES
jgi:hypothetical protein